MNFNKACLIIPGSALDTFVAESEHFDLVIYDANLAPSLPIKHIPTAFIRYFNSILDVNTSDWVNHPSIVDPLEYSSHPENTLLNSSNQEITYPYSPDQKWMDLANPALQTRSFDHIRAQQALENFTTILIDCFDPGMACLSDTPALYPTPAAFMFDCLIPYVIALKAAMPNLIVLINVGDAIIETNPTFDYQRMLDAVDGFFNEDTLTTAPGTWRAATEDWRKPPQSCYTTFQNNVSLCAQQNKIFIAQFRCGVEDMGQVTSALAFYTAAVYPHPYHKTYFAISRGQNYEQMVWRDEIDQIKLAPPLPTPLLPSNTLLVGFASPVRGVTVAANHQATNQTAQIKCGTGLDGEDVYSNLTIPPNTGKVIFIGNR